MDELEREQQKCRSILQITRAVGSTLDLDELLRLIVGKLTELMEADRSTLYLFDENKQELWTKVLEGDELRQIRLHLGQGIAGWVAQNGETVMVEDAYADARFNPEVDLRSGYRTQSTLCVPMRDHRGSITGVVQVLNKRGGRFTDEDAVILEALASHASVAIENSRLYLAQVSQNRELMRVKVKLERRARELDLLLEVEKLISETDSLEDLMDGLLARTTEIIGAEASSIVLKDQKTQRIYFSSATGQKQDAIKRFSVPQGMGICGWVIERSEPTISCRPESDGRYYKEIAQELNFMPRNILCVPLTGEGQTMGALELLNKVGADCFDEEDQTLLTLVAGRIAHAMHLEEARRERQVQSRLASIGQALSSLVHDIRTPMTIISGYAQLMPEADDRTLRKHYSEQIVKQSNVLSAMAEEVLAFARGESHLLIRKVYLNRFLKDMEEHFRAELAGKAIELVMEGRFDGVAYFDEPKLRRVFHNLARNAAEAMPKGGTFTCRVERRGDDLVLSFADTGHGIPKELEGRLFELFATAGKKEGTGLGLAIVRRIIEEHHGTITYVSTPGQGTTFTVTLPAQRPSGIMTGEFPQVKVNGT